MRRLAIWVSAERRREIAAKQAAKFRRIPRRSKPVRARSKRLESKMKIYRKRVAIFLAGKRCAVFPELPATDNHHSRGRNGPLLMDERFWIPVSRRGHEWIAKYPKQARALGLLCEVGKWNVPEKENR